MSTDDDIAVRIDGKAWQAISDSAEYDAAHAVAGALLAGAEEIEVERNPDTPGLFTFSHDGTVSNPFERDPDTPDSSASLNTTTMRWFPDLTQIPGVGASTAATLRNGGCKSIEDIQAASIPELANIEGITHPHAARIKAAVDDMEADA